MSPGKMAGKPAANRLARKPGLEIAFDPDAEPLADLTDPFATGEDGSPGPFAPSGDGAGGDEVPKAAVRRAPRPGATTPAQSQPAQDGAPAAETVQQGPQPKPGGAPAADEARAGATPPGRHADPAEAARALGIPLPLAKIEVTVSVEVGRTRLSLADLVSVEPGELVALDRMTTAPVDILVNGKPFARGEIVAIGERFGVRLTELLEPGELQ